MRWASKTAVLSSGVGCAEVSINDLCFYFSRVSYATPVSGVLRSVCTAGAFAPSMSC